MSIVVVKYIGIAALALALCGCVDPGVWVGLELGSPCARDGECRSQSCEGGECAEREQLDMGDAGDLGDFGERSDTGDLGPADSGEIADQALDDGATD